MSRFLNSAGVDGAGSLPNVCMRSTVAGSLRMRTVSALSRLRIGSGRPAGATRPCQALTSKPGTPLSAMVGADGSAKYSFALETASARSLPLRMNSIMVAGGSIMKSSRPPTSSITAGALPRYGTCSTLILVSIANSSMARCGPEPTPGVP